MDHLAAALKRGSIKDLLLFFPPNRREGKLLDEFFRKEGLPQVAEWYTKKQYALAKESIITELKDLCGHQESDETVRMFWLVAWDRCVADGVALDRSSLRYIASWRSNRFLISSLSSVRGRVSWLLWTGVLVRIRLRDLRFAK
jgi:hypothetical protein